jgi:hypothetical protein
MPRLLPDRSRSSLHVFILLADFRQRKNREAHSRRNYDPCAWDGQLFSVDGGGDLG